MCILRSIYDQNMNTHTHIRMSVVVDVINGCKNCVMLGRTAFFTESSWDAAKSFSLMQEQCRLFPLKSVSGERLMREHFRWMSAHKTTSIIQVQLGTGCDFWETQQTLPRFVYLLSIKTIKMMELCCLNGPSQQFMRTGRLQRDWINHPDQYYLLWLTISMS